MIQQGIEKYKDKKPIAVYPMSNWGGVEILAIEYGIDDYVVCRYFGTSYHKVKIRYGTRSISFRIGKFTIRFEDCIRTS